MSNDPEADPKPTDGAAVEHRPVSANDSLNQSGSDDAHNVSPIQTPTADSTTHLTPPIVPPKDSVSPPAQQPVQQPAQQAPLPTSTAQSNGNDNSTASPAKPPPPDVKPTATAAPRSLWETVKLWKGELIGALFAILMLVTELILFAHYDHKYIFPKHYGFGFTATWPFKFKINAMFALITAFMEAAVAFYTAACIGQLRWFWFRRKAHRLDWLDSMTNARGAPGALRLMFKKGMPKQFATLGALVVILLLFVSTFTQQAIDLVQRPYPPGGFPKAGGVPIQTAYSYISQVSGQNLANQMPLASMIAAIQAGFDSIAQSQPKLSVASIAYCNGDECDFGSYQSVAVCGGCSSESLPINNPCPGGNCNSSDYYTIANPAGLDLSLQATDGYINMTADMNYPVSADLKAQVGPLIVRLFTMYRLNATAPVKAAECAAWWCVQSFSSNITNNTLYEQKIGEWTDRSAAARTTGLSQRASINLTPPNCPITPNNNASVPPNCEYWIGVDTHRAIQNYLASPTPNGFGAPFLTGSATAKFTGNNTVWNVTSLPVDSLLQPITGTESVSVLVDAFTSMLSYMTVSLRETKSAGPTYPSWQLGTGTVQEQEFVVDWPWLTFPIVVVVMSLVFLVVTIILSRRDEIWKSSVLAMMFHSFGEDDRKGLGDLNSLHAMRKTTQEQKVQMEKQNLTPEGQWIFRTKSGRPGPHDEAYGTAGDGVSKIFGHGAEGFNEAWNAASS